MTDSIARLLERAAAARREGRLDEARRELLEAVNACRAGGNRIDLIRALKALGHVELDREQLDAARALYEEAVRLCREGGDPLALAHTVRHLGDVHRRTGRHAAAERCYVEALDLYRSGEGPPPLDLANAIRPLAIAKEQAGEADEARGLWEEARQLYEVAGIGEGVAECSEALGRLADPGSPPGGRA